MVIHLIYPHKRINSAPNIIGWKIYDFLNLKYKVMLYDWDDLIKITPEDGDILIGHPHPNPFTVFNRSFNNKNWGKRIILTPFNCDPRQNAFIDKYIYKADAYIPITGNYWKEQINTSIFSHWIPKFFPIELAIDLNSFPKLKQSFNSPGNRNIIYIGHTGWRKNTRYLEEIAVKIKNVNFFWCGKGKPLKGFEAIGYLNFSDKIAKEIISKMDFSITVGRFDANPTTILESMAWGLIPICTPTSGYNNITTIVNIPLDNIDKSVEILNKLNYADEISLINIQKENFTLIGKEFSWSIFLEKILSIIENDKFETKPIKKNLKKRLSMILNELKSPDFFLYPINIIIFLKDHIKKHADSI